MRGLKNIIGTVLQVPVYQGAVTLACKVPVIRDHTPSVMMKLQLICAQEPWPDFTDLKCAR
jgi:hypothetical protein